MLNRTSKLACSAQWLLGLTASMWLASSSAVADDYSDEILSLGPVGYWRLDESSGTTATDLASDNDGTYTNGVTLDATGAIDGNAAASFDGSNDYLEIPHDDDYLLDNGTVLFWFYTDDISGSGKLFSKDSSGYDTGGHLTIYTDSSRVKVRMQSKTASYTLQTDTLSDGQWYHVAFTWGSDGAKLYLNGSEEGTDSYTGGLGTTSGGTGNYEPIAVGSNTWNSDDLVVTPLNTYFEGTVDEVAIFDYALEPAQVVTVADAGFVFLDVTSSLGFSQSTSASNSYGSGWHWADFDDDGDLDAIATGGSAKVFLNSNAGESFFVSSLGSSTRRQGTLADFDHDGDVDFWAVNDNSYDTESMFENNGSGSFTDIGDAYFDDPSNNEGVAAADVNRDGWCDLVMFSNNGNWVGINAQSDPPMFSGSNSSSYGLNDSGDYGNGDYCSSGDVNNDGYPDFFYHYSSGKLFLSNGDGTWTENASGISIYTGNDDKIGSAWGDYDNDGDLDLAVARYDSGNRPYLFRNDDGTFTNVAISAGLDNTSGHRSVCWGDYDNDGDLDLYLVTRSGGNVLYQNQGDGTFSTVQVGASTSGDCMDAAFVDYDNDGDLDIAVTRVGANTVLLRNGTNNDNFLLVRVVGAGSRGTNLSSVGAWIELYDDGGEVLLGRRDIGSARGYGGAEPHWAHFGVPDPDGEYLVRVQFGSRSITVPVVPSEVSTTIGSRVIDQMLTIDESDYISYEVVQWSEKSPTGQ